MSNFSNCKSEEKGQSQMADTMQSVTSAGRSAGRAVGGAVGGLGAVATKTAARTREEVEDIWADARAVADKRSIPGQTQDKATYAGLAATAGLGLLEWPVAAAIGAGYALVRSTRNGGGQGRARSGSSRQRSSS
jgi:hypothetical protein